MNVIEWVLQTIDDEKLISNLLLNLNSHDLNMILLYLDYQNIEVQVRWISVYNDVFTFN